VLVVDDDDTVRMVLSTALATAGLQVEEASSGIEALDLAARRPYSVVLLDNSMPGMSGLQVLARLRADESTRTLPVVIVTAQDDVSARVEGLQQGADDYVTKPFHPDELVARVRAQMRGRAAWADVLERRLTERSAIAAALCRMHPEASAARTAEVLCDEIRELRQLAGAAVVLFPEEGGAVPLSVKGSAPDSLRPGVPLSADASADLRAHARGGPWVERGAARVAWAPFGTGTEPLGALGLVAADGEPDAAMAEAQLLATAIDFATVASGLLTPALLERGEPDIRRARLDDLLVRQAFAPVFQPIVRLGDGGVIGFEALTRFTDGTPPMVRFAEASALDRGIDLETATLAAALRAASGLPPGCWVSVNVSPALVLDGRRLRNLLARCTVQIVLELTEHDPVGDYRQLSDALDELRPAARLSVDDAGSGFASLRHVLALEPDYVKLDQSWVTGIHGDPARQALVAGLGHFAERTGSLLIAEGIETDHERGMLTELAVDLGQGYLFGRPLSMPAA
jgi:EAL domain-containing protein (putative c-di-GMP-specific phosphodiesterase class I)/DNA-binding response OmpR family regulator